MAESGTASGPAGGSRLNHLEAGSGTPALVLLHAFPFPAAMWKPQLDGLSDRVRVIAPELAPDRHESLDAMADSVAALLDDLEVTDVVVGGLSMGGYVAFAYWRRHGRAGRSRRSGHAGRARVRGVILADTRAGADTPEVKERRTSQQATVAQEGTRPIVEAMLKGLPGQHTQTNKPDVMAELERLMGQTSADYVTAALEAMKQRSDSTPDLEEIDVPVLVIVGEEDTLSPLDVAEEMLGGLPNGELAVIPQAGHLSNMENPGEFNRVVRAFLEKLA